MATIALRLDPRGLANPDLDIRYALPDLLIEQCGGIISDGGCGHVGDIICLLVLLQGADVERAIGCIREVIEGRTVLCNDLRDSIVVAVDRGDGYEVVYPAGFRGSFPA